MQYYVVTYTHTKLFGWFMHLYAHISYLKKLVKKGTLQVSGPGIGTPVRSAQLVFNVTDRKELDELIANDPFSIHGLVASKTINLWNVDYGDMKKPQAPDPDGTKYFRATYALKNEDVPDAVKQKRDAYLKKLLADRKMRAAGHYPLKPTEGLSILSLPDADAAEAIMQEDPYVKDLGASYQVIEWGPRYGEFK